VDSTSGYETQGDVYKWSPMLWAEPIAKPAEWDCAWHNPAPVFCLRPTLRRQTQRK